MLIENLYFVSYIIFKFLSHVLSFLVPVYDQNFIKGKSVPLQAWCGPEGSSKVRFPYFMTTAQDGGKVVNLTHRPSLPPGNSSGTHFCYRLSRPQGHSAIGRILCRRKFPMKPAGFEPATFRFVAQNLNHCTTADQKVIS